MLSRTPLAVALVLTSGAWAQSVISAHSGTIHYKEGQVELDGQPIQQDTGKGQFGEVKTGQTLTVKDGQAEILLTPGVFLRVAENSSFLMVSNKLADTRIQILSGSVMAEVGELLQDNAITLKSQGSEIALTKKGLYRIDSDPARLRVYDGEARVTSPSQEVLIARKGHEVALGGEKLEAKNFDVKQTDAFYNWCARRDEYVAEANIYAAKTARDSGYGYNGSGTGSYGCSSLSLTTYGSPCGNGMGSWAWNPWFGMFTYMPYSGMFWSPFGYGFYSPGMVGYLYMPGSPYYGTGGSSGAITRNGSTLTPRGIGGAASPVTRASGGVFNNGGGLFGNSGATSAGVRGGGGMSGGISSGGGGGISGGGISGGGARGGPSGGRH